MARFMGKVRGSRGEASRLGGKDSGLMTKANGWDVGVQVIAEVDGDDRDCFYIYATAGSGRSLGTRHIATVRGGIVTLENGEQAHRIDVEGNLVDNHLRAQDGRWEG